MRDKFFMFKTLLFNMEESENNEGNTDLLVVNELMEEMGLKGKPTMNKLLKIIAIVGRDKEKVKESFLQYKKQEDFANDIMTELGLKGKSTRIKVMRIIEIIGQDKKKIKVALMRSTITSRIVHD